MSLTVSIMLQGKKVATRAVDDFRTLADLRKTVGAWPEIEDGAFSFAVDGKVVVDRLESLLTFSEIAKKKVTVEVGGPPKEAARNTRAEGKGTTDGEAGEGQGGGATKQRQLKGAANAARDRIAEVQEPEPSHEIPRQVELTDFSKKIADAMGGKGKGSRVSGLDVSTDEVRRLMSETLKIPRAFRLMHDGTYEAAYQTMELADESAYVKVANAATRLNQSDVEVEAFASKRESDAFKSGYSNFSASLAAAFPVSGVDVGAALSYGSKKQKAQSSAEESSSQYLVARHDRPMRVVTFPLEGLRLTAEATQSIRSALAEPDPLSRHARLTAALRTYGCLVARQYVLGGRLFISEVRTVEKNATAFTEKEKQEFGLGLEAESKGVSGQGSLGSGSGTEHRSTSRRGQSRDSHRVRALGGNPDLAGDPAAWKEALADFRTWQPIAFDELEPIWKFLPESDQQACRNTVEELMVKAKERAEREASRRKAWQTLTEARDAMKNLAAKGAVRSRSVAFGAKDAPGSVQVQAIEIRESTDPYEFWKYGSKHQYNAHVKANDDRSGWIISCVNITSNRTDGTNGTFEIVDGGILADHVDVKFESEGTRGYSWTMEVFAAPLSELEGEA